MTTHQVLLQLFVVGNDAIVDDDKLYEKKVEVRMFSGFSCFQKLDFKLKLPHLLGSKSWVYGGTSLTGRLFKEQQFRISASIKQQFLQCAPKLFLHRKDEEG